MEFLDKNDKHLYIYKDKDPLKYDLILDLDQTLIFAETLNVKSSIYEENISSYINPIIKSFKENNRIKFLLNYSPIKRDKSASLVLMNFEKIKNRREEKISLSNNNNLINNDDKLCEFVLGNTKFIVYMRNYLLQFLFEMHDKFNIFIYTNATVKYTEIIIDEINKKFGCIFFVGFVSKKNWFNTNVKSLSVFDKNNISISKNVLIIDDREDVWCDEDKKHLIKIEEFIYKSKIDYFYDKELLKMIEKIKDRFPDIFF